MPNRLEFTIDGRPVPNKDLVGRNGRHYKPKGLMGYKVMLRQLTTPLVRKHDFLPFNTAISMTLIVFRSMPKSWSKKRRSEELGRPITTRPDTDNLTKPIKDAISRSRWWPTGYLINEDSQVSDDCTYKRWSERDYIKIILTDETKEIVE